MKKKKTILSFQKMKERGEKITFIVVYDYPTARLAEETGVDMLLVGDSVGTSLLGYESTNPVTMEEMIPFVRAVRKGAPNTFVIGDMPFGSYQISPEEAVRNAIRFYRLGVDAVKLEGGVNVKEQIRAIVRAGMSVMGHIGLTPQSSGQKGGYKTQGRTAESAMAVIKDALAVEEAGAFAVLLEAVSEEVGQIVTQILKIPVLSIGAGRFCDGQLLLDVDLLGKSSIFEPTFVERYANLQAATFWAFQQYIKEVREGKFPQEKHCDKMKEGEYEKLIAALKSILKLKN